MDLQIPINLNEEAAQAANGLINAVNVSLSPYSSQAARIEAFQLCEKFKEESPYCGLVGFSLALNGKDATVRHFGFQLVEHCIKFRWNSLPLEEKVFIKDAVWRVIENADFPSDGDGIFMKDAVARLVVEMVKREWPQHWPSFLTELMQLCNGENVESRTHLALLVLLRLTEDVAVLQTVESPQRRKELQQSLTTNMAEIFKFLNFLLQRHVTLYKNLKLANDPAANVHCRLSQAVLTTLYVHLDWVSINHIMADDAQLLQNLCLLLSDEGLRAYAAECLLQTLERKGPAKERKPLLILFSQGAISSMLNAAETSAAHDNYNFLKRLAEVLVSLGLQLCNLYGKEPDIEKPENFSVYLQAMLALTRHSSLSINQTAMSLWLAFFRHEQISTDPELKAVLEPWISVVSQKFIKVGYPSRNDDISCAFSRLDFDSDEEFSQFLLRYRTDLVESVRRATSILPHVTFSCAAGWVRRQLERQVMGEELGLCSPTSPSVLEWEALAVFLDCVFSRAFVTCEAQSTPDLTEGFRLLENCLRYETSDPLILSALLSCISAMFVLVQWRNEILQAVLDKIFAAMMFTLPGQTKDSRSRAVRNVRRHACSLMVKISRQFPKLLLPFFPQLKTRIDSLCQDQEAGQLSKMESCTLQEALLLISNRFENFDMQSSFIGSVIGRAAGIWTSPQMNAALESAPAFMAFVGLDRPPVEPSCSDINGINRSELVYCTNVFNAVVKRCKYPDDNEAAAKGGFLVSQPDGSSVLRHPAAPHFSPLLVNIFRLARTLHGLWDPNAKRLLSEGYVKAYDMVEMERLNTLGLGPSSGGNSLWAPGSMEASPLSTADQKVVRPLERMQQFLAQLHFSVFQLLGGLGETLGQEFYALPGLSNAVAGTACYCIEHLPDYRLRPVIRVFCKPFITNCPPAFYSAVIGPFLAHLCPAMLHKLSARWQSIMEACAERETDEDSADLQEVVEDMIGRQLTKDYLDLVRVILFISSAGDASENTMDQDEVSPADSAAAAQQRVSELGKQVIPSDIFPSIFHCVLSAVWWPDSGVSVKAVLLLTNILKHWASGGQSSGFPNSSLAGHILTCVLRALETVGKHESNLGFLIFAGIQTYELFRPVYPSVADILMQAAKCSREDIEKLDEKISSGGGITGSSQAKHSSKSEKAKRDTFRKIVTNIIGKQTAELYRREVHIRDLPPLMPVRRKLKPLPLTEANAEEIGLVALFSEDD